MESVLRDRMSLIAALGAGVVVGISGIYLYYKVNKCVTRELSELSGTIENLRREIEELKEVTKPTKDKKLSPERRKNVSTLIPGPRHRGGYTSSIEDPDEEYFDFTDTEDLFVWTAVNGPYTDSPAISESSDWLDDLDNILDSDSSDKESLYVNMTSKKEKNLDNIEFLWRLAKATHLYGNTVGNRGETDKKKELAFEAFSYAKMAYELTKDHAEVHKWYAITVGSLGDYVGTQEKIVNGYSFKEHLDQALKLKPMDPTLHHMFGRWCFEVASLSWLERKLATTLFSSPPEATLEEAREHLAEADRLKPDWKENLLYMAKAFIGEGDYSNAIGIIDKACELPIKREDDIVAQKELETLQYKYQTYRMQ